MQQRAGRTEAKETEAWSPPWALLATGTIQDFMSKQMPAGLRSSLSTWQNWKEQRGKKGEFFIEGNKYGDMETGGSANRSGLGFDGAAGPRCLPGSKGFQPQPFPVSHHPFCYTPHVSGWKTHPHMQYHIQACNSRKSVAHQGKSLLV